MLGGWVGGAWGLVDRILGAMLRYACICVSKYSTVFTDKYSC